MKKTLIIAASIALISTSVIAAPAAQNANAPKPAQAQQQVDPKEQAKKNFLAVEAKWKKMSKADKVKMLNEEHERNLKNMKEQWSKLNDDQKIEQREKALENGRKHFGL
jgi:opacity protein-like surface antigen